MTSIWRDVNSDEVYDELYPKEKEYYGMYSNKRRENEGIEELPGPINETPPKVLPNQNNNEKKVQDLEREIATLKNQVRRLRYELKVSVQQMSAAYRTLNRTINSMSTPSNRNITGN